MPPCILTDVCPQGTTSQAAVNINILGSIDLSHPLRVRDQFLYPHKEQAKLYFEF
jgi:hypothetical protein